MRGARWIGGLGLVVLAVVAVGFAAASQWYADDACPIEGWKCELGTLSLVGVLFGGPIALLLLSVSLVIAWFARGRSQFLKRASAALGLAGAVAALYAALIYFDNANCDGIACASDENEGMIAGIGVVLLILAAISWARAASDPLDSER